MPSAKRRKLTSSSTFISDGQLEAIWKIANEEREGGNPDERCRPVYGRDLCLECGQPQIKDFSTSTLICDCGVSENAHFAEDHYRLDLVNPEEYNEVTPYYKLEGHWREVNAQLRGEGGNVQIQMVEDVRTLYIINGKDPKKATKEETIEYMGRTGWNKYYEHAIQVTSILNGQEPDWANSEEQELLDRRFCDAVQAWMNAPPSVRNGRTSFMNYQDFALRCCLMDGFYHLICSLKALKTGKTIKEINKIWAYFGEYCHWPNWKKGLIPEKKVDRRRLFESIKVNLNLGDASDAQNLQERSSLNFLSNFVRRWKHLLGEIGLRKITERVVGTVLLLENGDHYQQFGRD